MISNASRIIDPLRIYRPERSSSSFCWSLQPRGLRQEAVVSIRMVDVCPSLAAMMSFGASMATEFCTDAIANKVCRPSATVLLLAFGAARLCPRFVLSYSTAQAAGFHTRKKLHLLEVHFLVSLFRLRILGFYLLDEILRTYEVLNS